MRSRRRIAARCKSNECGSHSRSSGDVIAFDGARAAKRSMLPCSRPKSVKRKSSCERRKCREEIFSLAFAAPRGATSRSDTSSVPERSPCWPLSIPIARRNAGSMYRSRVGPMRELAPRGAANVEGSGIRKAEGQRPAVVLWGATRGCPSRGGQPPLERRRSCRVSARLSAATSRSTATCVCRRKARRRRPEPSPGDRARGVRGPTWGRMWKCFAADRVRGKLDVQRGARCHQ